MTAQICVVNKTLMSVSKIASKGNRVVFDDDVCFIKDKTTGERSWITQVGGHVLAENVGVPQELC